MNNDQYEVYKKWNDNDDVDVGCWNGWSPDERQKSLYDHDFRVQGRPSQARLNKNFFISSGISLSPGCVMTTDAESVAFLSLTLSMLVFYGLVPRLMSLYAVFNEMP